ncbi:hypothetical protein CAPN004_10320 [Capnocytophaga cynodegmi]|uniref:YopX family protein n=1 Tax=Capnocytophaga cynodegmi TaxID=28189 RepID=UPI001AC68E7A|nr:YopX family protein [Capnocytophaga cynodegmi]GIM52002.1 hypothetical protein CAPN004_10320 [Capnocytophaga cynodegmi]
MQREIKFRVFDKEAKTMHKVSSIDFENKEVFIYDKNGFDKNLSFDEIELMQFTGLTDKNGGEVYEGDVLNCEDWKEPSAVKWIKEECNFNIVEFGIHKVEIIGNIYKTPELLK